MFAVNLKANKKNKTWDITGAHENVVLSFPVDFFSAFD